MYGKLISGVLIEAPFIYKNANGDLIVNFKANKKLMAEYGFKLVEDNPLEYDKEMQILNIIGYTETDEKIVVNYEVVEKPLTVESRVELIETQLQEQADILSEEVNRIE